MVNLYLLTKSGPTHFSVSPSIFGLFDAFLNFLKEMVKNWSDLIFLKFQVWKLLPLQGVLLIAIIPRALPWAMSFCPFRAFHPRLRPQRFNRWFLPLKYILNVKNIPYFKYYIAYLYYFRFIFVSLQQI